MNGIPRLTYQQYRAVRRLVHDCCNYDGGNCLALDDGWEPCVCVQSITYSLVCKWFRAAVLPTDKGPLLLWHFDANRVGNELRRAGPPAVLLGSFRKIDCRGGGIAESKRAGTRTAHVCGNGTVL